MDSGAQISERGIGNAREGTRTGTRVVRELWILADMQRAVMIGSAVARNCVDALSIRGSYHC